jgi:hypothetical protein
MRSRVFFFSLIIAPFVVTPAQGQEWGDELPSRIARPESLISIGSRQLEPIGWPAPPLVKPPKSIRAVYLNAWVFGGRRFYDLVRLADSTEINAFVIDIKDDTGYLTYRSSVHTAVEIGANNEVRAPDVRERLQVLHAHGIYPIARIVVAKDPLLATRKTDWSIQHSAGGLWRDRRNFAWVDAFKDSVWVYAGQLGEEAVRLGFSELQFDYVRFPDEPKSKMASAVFAARQGNETTRQGVTRNIRMLRERMRPLGVPFTIDIFGMTTSTEVDMGIGQVWEDLVTAADVVLPMVYPSHYYGGFGDIQHPNSEPYKVVRRAIEDGIRRSAPLGQTAEIRPWLQAFTLGAPRYTPYHVKEQIRAVEDLGLTSWILWNASGRYDPGSFRPEPPSGVQVGRTVRSPRRDSAEARSR